MVFAFIPNLFNRFMETKTTNNFTSIVVWLFCIRGSQFYPQIFNEFNPKKKIGSIFYVYRYVEAYSS